MNINTLLHHPSVLSVNGVCTLALMDIDSSQEFLDALHKLFFYLPPFAPSVHAIYFQLGYSLETQLEFSTS